MRSTNIMPVALSSSYLTLEPLGISMTALNMAGASSPMSRSCHGWDAAYLPLLILGAVARTSTSVSMAPAELRGRFMYVESVRARSASQVQSCDSLLTWHSMHRIISARASCPSVKHWCETTNRRPSSRLKRSDRLTSARSDIPEKGRVCMMVLIVAVGHP